EIFLQLEDHQVTLSTMKASRFVKAFEKVVDMWERALSLILECIEMILTVQRQWMYLENIFLGEDIRKQLPRESAEFDDVNSNWKVIMTRLNKDNNAKRGTHHPGLLEVLNDMNMKLEEIQKSLDMYLETKRQIFPRFYFLSNDDLLEILGQSRNPEAVQPHLKKCFDNIKSLLMKKVGHGNRMEASGMFSCEGEYVEFGNPVLLEGPVEAWLCDVEQTMRWTLKEVLKQTRIALKKMISKRDKWVKEWPGQVPLITASQIQWTADCIKALITCKERQDKKALKSVKKKQVSMLNKYSEAIRGNLNKNQRSKVVALVTIEVHARDVIDKLIKTGTNDVTAFEWLQQLRVYWDKDIDDCVVRQTNTQFQYGYEYLGNSGRLVITPLTDRCYVTLTTALHLHRGGSPKGPAGTGKTETVKDLGKALGMYVIVVNCSEGLDYKSMGRMYSGLAQTGAWGCFDEFNRINIEVLSVVAQQILSILSALSTGLSRFVFEGREISLIWSCGIFITMNPGYAGRTELPDNLKSMFRPIAMVVPDSNLISEIILFGEGFGNCRPLAKKVYTLYSLAIQQLSKQDHYDFGLRALVSVLRYAGRKKRGNPEMSDEEILLLAMKDMNNAKLTAVDLPLFNGIVGDLFPGSSNSMRPRTPRPLSDELLGQSGAGKSVTWRMLQAALSRMKKNGVAGFNLVKVGSLVFLHTGCLISCIVIEQDFPINPKALSLGELYGEFDLSTNEWTDGVLSSVMRHTCADEKPDEKWMVFDGPVDTLWIESMNSVMDDNKVLTLINGERVSMPEQVSLLFEVGDLSVASPATVSRCGMVYFDYIDLGYRPFIASWLQQKSKVSAFVLYSFPILQDLIDKYLDKAFSFKKHNCIELVPLPELNGVRSLCNLFDTLATAENGKNCTLYNLKYFNVLQTFIHFFFRGYFHNNTTVIVINNNATFKGFVNLFLTYLKKLKLHLSIHVGKWKEYCIKIVNILKNTTKNYINNEMMYSINIITNSSPNIAHQVNPSDSENFPRMVELWFLFSLIWSVGAAVDEDGRRKLDNFLRELEGSFPNKVWRKISFLFRCCRYFLLNGTSPILITKQNQCLNATAQNELNQIVMVFISQDTVYEYYVDPKSRSWVNFEEKLQKGWRYSPTAPFYRIMVPTVDTVRYDFLVTSLILRGFPVLLVGPVGTGKTSTAQNVLSKLDVTKYLTLTINMSSQTTSNNVQDIIESRVEKRTKGVYVPIGSKKMITFMDDFNMPAKDTFGSQPPLELIRQWIDYSFWYDRQKQITKHIKVIYSDMYLLCDMGPPGGGRQVISQRLQTRFNLINMTFPSVSLINKIYGTMINQKLQDFEEDVKPIGDIITQATIDVYRLVVEKFLPTPAKIHYLFNLRDISKVFQGLLRAHKDFHDTKHSMTRLWIHECFRVFSDRLVDAKDTENFIGMLSDRLGALFDQTYHNMCPNKQPPLFGQLFCDFLNTNEVYEDLMEFQLVKKYMEDQMEDYNMTPGVVPMDLVLFKDAIEHGMKLLLHNIWMKKIFLPTFLIHIILFLIFMRTTIIKNYDINHIFQPDAVARIIRVIRRPRGNILLIGIGGSGRQSLARLASYMCEYTTFQIEVSRHYRKQEFRDDLKRLYYQAGVENKPTVFLFNDTQVVEEIFLEDINNILSSGEVPNLYKPIHYIILSLYQFIATVFSLMYLVQSSTQHHTDFKTEIDHEIRADISDLANYHPLSNIIIKSHITNPILSQPDEFEEVRNELEAAAKAEGIAETPDAMFKFLIDRVRNNLHLALCMSPVGELFRNRIRQYPAFVNCTTIDLFTEWPHDALLEVAEKYLEGLDLGSGEDMNKNVAQIFVTMHRSVVTYSEKLLFELKRHNYVTPTNYLELVSGYKGLLFEKRKELGDQVTKLRNGLFKIDDTRAKVEAMSIDLEQAKTKVAQFQKECEEYLVVIVQQKREADEQQKSVAAYSERIGAEEVKCKTMADNAQRDLDEAIPALEEAKKALEALNKKDITEIKSYGRPPALVEMVLQAVMILRGMLKKIGQQYVAHSEFHVSICCTIFKEFCWENMIFALSRNNCYNATLKLCRQNNFCYFTQPDNVGRVSVAAQSLCLWVRAMELFGRIYRVVEPKRQRLDAAMEQLKEKQASLAEAKRKLEEVTEKMENLKKQKSAEKEELKRKAEETELKLTRAGKLVAGLAGEKIRWEATAENLEESMGYLVGDCLVASAFLSYMGPFLSNYRDEMVEKIWLKQVRTFVPCSPNFTFANFLSKPTQTREWNLQGLPSDAFSTENGVIVTRGDRWPLMVDPQGQAIKWIKNMEGRRGLKIIDLQQHDYLRTLENSIQFGSPVLLQNVQEELDPSLAPILNKAITKVGGRMLIKLGDKEIEYNTEFKFYITTKLSNPHYAPEISTKTSIVNFAVKEQGLEAQLLGTVVRKERPELEEQVDSLVINIASGKNKLQELEDEILRLLNEAQGSLLDDEQLVNTLHSSKTISAEVSEQLQVSEQTERKIDAAREGYRPCAQRASILFFVLNDMGRIDPMYQFSLDSFIDLFNQSIDKSQKSPKLENRINNLNEYHTYAVYRYTCRGLFEMHKMLFSFQMCAKILESASKINMDEYNFFLRGGVISHCMFTCTMDGTMDIASCLHLKKTFLSYFFLCLVCVDYHFVFKLFHYPNSQNVLDREGQMDNPCPNWLADSCWDNITELDKLTNFHGIMTSFEQYPLLNPRQLHCQVRRPPLSYNNSKKRRILVSFYFFLKCLIIPHAYQSYCGVFSIGWYYWNIYNGIFGEWENSCNELQRMVIVRSLRSDRVSFCATSFIVNNLGSKFVEPPVLDMKQVVDDSTPRSPLIFVLSPGVDPTSGLLQLAEQCEMAHRFHALSLGQGQAPIATRMIKEGVKDGNWVFLANCHLSLSWMPQLDKLVEQLQVEEPHGDFRLWLSSSPHPDFPISILQVGIKMTTEPPKGLKANMKRLYHLIQEPQFTRCTKPAKYKKLLFSLCFFHSLLIERKKFLMLGWNIIYGFNDSDFEVLTYLYFAFTAYNLLSIYLDEYDETPWEALKYLIAGVNYGGHITDDWDRRLLHSYINTTFNNEAVSTTFYNYAQIPFLLLNPSIFHRLSTMDTYYIPKDGTLATYKEYISMLPNVDNPEAFGQHPNADIASQITEARTLFETLLSLQPK
uniref:AAA+ ATPase domain-containing protein n=1 Tax=Ciona savignyi TaxID=51511 RepID=H2ZI85_CIOSA